MLKNILTLLLATALYSSAVLAAPRTEVPYTVATSYFVRNDYQGPTLAPLKIESREAFDQVFGTAVVMGSQATPIDFDKQYVIAIVGPVVSSQMQLSATALQQTADQLLLSLKVEPGQALSYSIQPALILLVDKQYNGTVVLAP